MILEMIRMIPEYMTAMVFEDINVIKARQVPTPKPGRGEALVKIMASGLCITDEIGRAHV